MRTPDELDGVSWLNYLKDAVEREAGIQWTPPGYMVGVWVKQLMKLRDEGVNPYQLALALDLVALRWERYCLKSPWELLTPGMLFYAFRSLVRPELFWRSVWFSRFAETGDEVKYLAYWLTQFEAALAAQFRNTRRFPLVRFDNALALVKLAVLVGALAFGLDDFAGENANVVRRQFRADFLQFRW